MAGGLVVVGAALGAGRWLAEQLGAHGRWSRTLLVDTAPIDPSVQGGGQALTALPADLGDVRAAVVAVPASALDPVLTDLAAALPGDAELVVVANPMAPAVALLQRMPQQAWTAHLLFDPALTAGDGQGVFVAPAAPPTWFADALEGSGALLRTGDAASHDAAMAVVQGATHRTLVAFADEVTASVPDLDALWSVRTPLFDSLLALTTRALDPRQQAQVAALQTPEVQRAAAAARDRISGTLFEELRTTAAAGIQAAQARRGEIARHLREGTLVGLRRAGAPDSVRVGRVRAASPTHVALDVLLAGPPGRAALLDGPGLANAARLGVPKRVARHDFGAGHVEVLGEAELQRLLDERLAFLPRDVRFLVPESVSGAGVTRVVARAAGLRDVRLVDEVVRTGQRSVVVHLAVRADRDVDATVEAVRRDVAAAYAWPVGVTRAPARAELEVVYLGPAGTFSETAARQAGESLGLVAPRLTALPSFDAVLGALRPGVVGVLPITSSASGLVGRAVDALLAAPPVVASGVVDVAVRFDAYVRGPEPLERLRGRQVFSHPQGLAQCTRFVARWGLAPVPTASTAEALAMVERSDEPAVALGGADLGGPLRVAEREVDDLSGSITRFLVVGVEGEFAAQREGADPTLRSLWVGGSAADAVALLPTGGAVYSEVLTDADGRFLLVSSGTNAEAGAARRLGVLPWSPRTPIVRPAAD
ncbi:prephenate dehydratase domain-containing protein [Amnibacterium endophyticum]|uniref:prephenate dehydratase n=1 Tax=Amnibacterium endophyticum TaxID=2109337 RepID=A0ABW4LD95_9MICO